MKIALISDIHGNYVALKEVMNQIDSLGILEVYCLGDVVGYYSQVNECCEELRERNIRCVLGNHDWYMVSGTDCQRSKSVRDCMVYQRKIITAENKKWIESFPVTMNVHNISMVHGGWNNPIDEYLEVDETYFTDIKGTYFASGHTHVQKIEKFGDKAYCNPGSVGQPRDGDNRAAFATFDGDSFELYRINYDIEMVGYLMNRAGFHPYYYGCLKDASQNLHA